MMTKFREMITIKQLLGLLALFIVIYGCETPGTGLGIREFDDILERDSDVVCLDDGFDKRCILVIPGPAGKDGVDGVDGIDGVDGVDGKTIYLIPSQSLTQAVHVIPQQILTQAVHVIHADNLSFADPIPVPTVQIETPASDLTASRKIYVEAVTDINGAIIITPAAHITPADTVIYVSNLTAAKHTNPPDPSKIWHIAIYDTDDGVDLYVYPRSLPPNDRLNFHEGEGTELQGTRAGVNELLRVYLSEHNTHILSVLGDETIIDAELR